MKKNIAICSALFGFIALPSLSFAELPCKSFTHSNAYELSSPILDEISGLAVSRSNGRFLWAHTDSGNSSELYVIDHSGAVFKTYTVKGVQNIDWEDIALGPCAASDARVCIYISDMGDNLFKRADKQILIIEEPDLSGLETPTDEVGELSVIERISVKFPESQAPEQKFANPDCESVMVQPGTAEIYFVSKQSSGGEQSLYHIKKSEAVDGMRTGTPEKLASYEFTSALGSLKPLFNAVTAADFAPDGKRFAVRSYAEVYEYDVEAYGSMAEAFVHPTKVFVSAELQGESLAYDKDGRSLVTACEKYMLAVATINLFSCDLKKPSSGGGEDPEPGGGEDPEPGGGEDPEPGGGEDPEPGGGEDPEPGGGEDPEPGGGEDPEPGGGEDPEPGGGESPEPGGGESPEPGGGEDPEPGGGESPEPGGGEDPEPGGGEAPEPGGEEFDSDLDYHNGSACSIGRYGNPFSLLWLGLVVLMGGAVRMMRKRS